MTERRADIPPFASVVKQKMKELFDHHVLIYEGCKSEVRDLQNNIKTLNELNDSLQKEVAIVKERNDLLHSENMRLKEDLVNTSTRLSLPCENCRSLMYQLEQQNKLLCTMMERKDQNLGEIIGKYLSKKSEIAVSTTGNTRANNDPCPRDVIDTLSQALSISQNGVELNVRPMEDRKMSAGYRQEQLLSGKDMTENRKDLSCRKDLTDNRKDLLDKTKDLSDRKADVPLNKIQHGGSIRRSNESRISKEKVEKDQKVSPETLKRTGKLTQAGKRRRARYTEETTPENKKKKLSPGSTTATCEGNTELSGELNQINKVFSPPGDKILAPDTCDVSLCRSPPTISLKAVVSLPKIDKGLSAGSELELVEKVHWSMGHEDTMKEPKGTGTVSDNRRNKVLGDDRRNKGILRKGNVKEVGHCDGFTVPDTLAMDMPSSDSDSEINIHAACAEKKQNSSKYQTIESEVSVKAQAEDKDLTMKRVKTDPNQKVVGKHDHMKSLLISPPSLSSTPVSAFHGHLQNHRLKDLNKSVLGSLATFCDEVCMPQGELYVNEDEDSNDANIIQASPNIVKKKSVTKSFKQSSLSLASNENSLSPPHSPVFGCVESINKVEKLKASNRKGIGSPSLFEESPRCISTKKSHDFTDGEDSSLLLAKPTSEGYLVDQDTASHDTSLLNRSRRYRSPLKFSPNMTGEVKKNRQTWLSCGKSVSQRSDESLTSPSVISGRLVQLDTESQSEKSPALLRKTKSSIASAQPGRSSKVKGNTHSQNEVSSQGRSRSKVHKAKGSGSPIGKLVIEKSSGKSNQKKKLFQTKINSESFHGKKSATCTRSKAKEFNGRGGLQCDMSLTQQEEELIEKAKQASLRLDRISGGKAGNNQKCSPNSKRDSLFTSTPAVSKANSDNDNAKVLRLVTSPIPMDHEADTRNIDTLHFHEDCSNPIANKDDNSELIFKKPMLPLTPKRRNSLCLSNERNETLRRSPRLKEKTIDNRGDQQAKSSSARKLSMNGKSVSGTEDTATNELDLKDLNDTLDPHFNMSDFDSVPNFKTDVQDQMSGKQGALANKKPPSKTVVNSDNAKGISGTSRRVTRSCVETEDGGDNWQGRRHTAMIDKPMQLSIGEEAEPNIQKEELQCCEEDYSEKSAVFGPVSLKPSKTKQSGAVSNTETHRNLDSDRTKGHQQQGMQKDAEDINSSFDRIPNNEEKLDYKYVDVVRKKSERDKLDGYVCIECDRYFNGMDIPEEERLKRMRAVCRHKAKFAPPDTPEHYWSVGFPDTQECKERGYLNTTQAKPSKFRRRKPLKQLSTIDIKTSATDETSDISD